MSKSFQARPFVVSRCVSWHGYLSFGSYFIVEASFRAVQHVIEECVL